MRLLVWCVLALLCCVGTSYNPQKTAAKAGHKKVSHSDVLPPLADGDQPDSNEYDDEPLPRSSNKNKQNPKQEDDTDTQDEWEICDQSRDEACVCEQNEVICDKIMFKGQLPLDTTRLIISQEGFVVHRATFKENAITRLRRGKILEGHQREFEELDFSNNRIMHIETGTFDGMDNLKKLFLNDNLLTIVKKSWWQEDANLHQLYLANNKIQTLEDGVFSNLKNLKVLVLDGNQIKFRKEMFAGLDSLEKLSLDNCGLGDDMDVDLFDNIPHLQTLSLRNNRFVEVPRALNAIKQLQNLDISGTNVAEIHAQSLKDDHFLKQLYIQDMPFLYAVQDCAFCGLEKLQMVHMSNNTKLYEIHSNAFGFEKAAPDAVTSLKHFYVEGCNLTTLSETLLNWDEVEELGIGGNPLICDCDTAFLLGDAMFSYEYTNKIPKCAGPPTLKGKLLAKLHQYEACEAIAQGRKTNRAMVILSVLLVCVFACAGVYLLWSSGRLSKLWQRAKDERNAFPAMTYANLNHHTEENTSLESDFQPRPEEV